MWKNRTIREAINRVLWGCEDRDRYSLLLVDRFEGLVEVSFRYVRGVDKGYVYVDTGSGVKPIPIHRVRAILRDGVEVWGRGSKG
ncbi:MAG: DUF504 domain-containing protein [Thermoprotei archaeon]|nr:MAG: DUF504 domain-containing protein [Thermoprotei archaeon]